MYKIDHPNIIKLYNHYEEEEYIYLILECATVQNENILIFTFKGWLIVAQA